MGCVFRLWDATRCNSHSTGCKIDFKSSEYTNIDFGTVTQQNVKIQSDLSANRLTSWLYFNHTKHLSCTYGSTRCGHQLVVCVCVFFFLPPMITSSPHRELVAVHLSSVCVLHRHPDKANTADINTSVTPGFRGYITPIRTSYLHLQMFLVIHHKHPFCPNTYNQASKWCQRRYLEM